MKEVDVHDLQELMDKGADYQLIDVREPDEYERANLNGELIPVNSVPDNVDKVDRKKQVIVHCRSGKRSARAIQYLEENYGYDNLYNLEGGILAFKNEIDPELDVD